MNIRTLDPRCGDTLNSTLDEAYQASAFPDTEVRFVFNGCEIRIRQDSPRGLVLRDYSRSLSGYHKEPVGPYPPLALTAEQEASDEAIRIKNERRWAEQKKQYEEEQGRKRQALESEIQRVEMAISNPDAWQEITAANQDLYGGGILHYAESWARLMQARMAKGATLQAVVKQASFDADAEGITGFMYGAAVSILSKIWVHGEELRRWHNIETQIGDEGIRANDTGGTLNPALLSIGTKE